MKASLVDYALFEIWLRETKRLNESSIFVYVRSIKRFLATDPDVDNVENYNEFIIKNSIKKRCPHYFYALKKFIEYKIDDSSLRNRLVNELEKPVIQDPITPRRYLTAKERNSVIDNLERKKHQIIAIIQFLTGVRAGDILRLKRGHIFHEVYKDKEVLRLNLLGKGNKLYVVFIHDKEGQNMVMDYITNTFHHEDYYFLEIGRNKRRAGNIGNENMMVKMNYLWYWIDLKQALQTIGVNKKDFATHDFRRCFAREVWEKYTDMQILQNVLNHSDPKVTMRYLKFSGLQNIDVLHEMQS